MSLGQYIKQARGKRGLSQWDLARLSGLTRSHLSRLELDSYQHSSAVTFLSLAEALQVSPQELYEAAGYIENREERVTPPENAQQSLAELDMPRLARIPVLAEIQSEVPEVVSYVYWGLSEHLSDNIVGVLAKGFCLEPSLDVKEDDVILVDRKMTPSPGNIILCHQDKVVHLIRYPGTTDHNGGSGRDSHIYGVVIGVNRNLI
ncbi:MAG: helix-turn-helix transcriptional regulator [Dehalococcoidia bacterium]|nr:helix-turn-helix transcriptional regulator [Dehalococcoidia bacterium]